LYRFDELFENALTIKELLRLQHHLYQSAAESFFHKSIHPAKHQPASARIHAPAEFLYRDSSDDWRRNSSYFKEPALTQNLALAETLKSIGKKHGRSAGEVAIAWTLRNPAVTAAIVGGRSAGQVDGISRAWDFHLTEEDLAEYHTQPPT